MIPEIEKTIEHCVEYATELLTETGEAYPFGAFIDTIGNVHPLEMEVDKKNVPNIGEVVANLKKYCEEEIAANRMRGYALCYEVAVELENGEEQDCICIDITHCEEDVDAIYLPFKAGESMDIGELFAVRRNE